jgi:hypothetical protein
MGSVIFCPKRVVGEMERFMWLSTWIAGDESGAVNMAPSCGAQMWINRGTRLSTFRLDDLRDELL